MEKSFYRLPPSKRIMLMKQLEEDEAKFPPLLPAKKRKESRSPPELPPNSTTFCLPAKKRICAFQPDFSPQNPISTFDLNVEYNPLFEEEDIKNPSEEQNIQISNAITGETEISAEEEENRVEQEEHGEEEEDDGILCAVCESTDGDPSDPIVFCDSCDLMVHTTCYGDPLTKGIPEDDWFCSQCLASQSSKTEQNKDKKNLKVNPFSCCLCTVSSGALKPTKDGRWAHIVCALLIPEVFFGDPEGREGIDCSKIPTRRWKEKCYLCKSGNGCVLDCSEPKCRLGFHVTCGLKEDLCIEYREGKNRGAIVAGFCRIHTDLWKKQQETGKFKIVARDEQEK